MIYLFFMIEEKIDLFRFLILLQHSDSGIYALDDIY